MVYKPDSISTSVRLVNNTSVIAKAETTTLSIECPAVTKFINKLESCLIHFLLYDHPLAADLAYAYRQILVDEQTSYLRLCIWIDQDDMPGCQDPIIMRRVAWDFGDAAAGVALEIGNRKQAAGACSLPDTIEMVKKRRYVDNMLTC